MLTRENIMALTSQEVWMTTGELYKLQEYEPMTQGVSVEIGCAFGGSTVALLSSQPKGNKLISIDPFVRDSKGNWSANKLDCEKAVLGAMQTLNNQSFDWELINDFSFNAILNWSHKVSLLFIDGDHEYNSVKKDFEDWYPFVNFGGYILIHDSQRPDNIPEKDFVNGWPGPTQLVKELRGKKENLEFLECIDSLSIFRKV